jgi:hypothetical protein
LGEKQGRSIHAEDQPLSKNGEEIIFSLLLTLINAAKIKNISE